MKEPANRHLPLLLIDVDGVISLYRFDPDRRPEGAFLTVDGIAHFLSATAGEHLLALSDAYELMWCTGWEEKANEYLPHALGLSRPLPHLSFSGAPATDAEHWKLAAIEAHAGPHRALAWIDDDHAGCGEWAALRPGPTLLVTTEPHTGMTPAHVDRLLAWAQSLSASPDQR